MAELVINSLGVVGEVRFSLEVDRWEVQVWLIEDCVLGGSSGGQLDERELFLIR